MRGAPSLKAAQYAELKNLSARPLLLPTLCSPAFELSCLLRFSERGTLDLVALLINLECRERKRQVPPPVASGLCCTRIGSGLDVLSVITMVNHLREPGSRFQICVLVKCTFIYTLEHHQNGTTKSQSVLASYAFVRELLVPKMPKGPALVYIFQRCNRELAQYYLAYLRHKTELPPRVPNASSIASLCRVETCSFWEVSLEAMDISRDLQAQKQVPFSFSKLVTPLLRHVLPLENQPHSTFRMSSARRPEMLVQVESSTAHTAAFFNFLGILSRSHNPQQPRENSTTQSTLVSHSSSRSLVTYKHTEGSIVAIVWSIISLRRDRARRSPTPGKKVTRGVQPGTCEQSLLFARDAIDQHRLSSHSGNSAFTQRVLTVSTSPGLGWQIIAFEVCTDLFSREQRYLEATINSNLARRFNASKCSSLPALQAPQQLLIRENTDIPNTTANKPLEALVNCIEYLLLRLCSHKGFTAYRVRVPRFRVQDERVAPFDQSATRGYNKSQNHMIFAGAFVRH